MQTLSASDLEALYRDILAELAYFSEHLPFKDRDDTTVILKGHLLIEELLVAYVAIYLKKPEKIERFTFDQYLRLAEALNSVAVFDWVFEACRKLNHIRNGISHQLSPSGLEDGISEFITYVVTKGVHVFPANAVACNRPEFRMAILAVYTMLRHLNRKTFRPLTIPTILQNQPNQAPLRTPGSVTPAAGAPVAPPGGADL